MSEQPHPILLGCCAWSFPDWEGPLYPLGMKPAEFLGWYSDRFPIVEVDSTFYGCPKPSMTRGWRERTPSGFKFALKVPKAITHEKQLQECEEDVERFVSAIEPLGDKLFCALLQMGYFNKGAFGSLEEFLGVLDAFLAAWPFEKVPLAVEIRNPRWVGPELTEVLRDHGAALTLNEQKWMSTPAQMVERIDPVTGPFAYVRLMGDRESIEKIATSWDKLVLDKSAELEKTAEVIRSLADRVPVVAFASNFYAGHAPATVRDFRALLGQADPVPPERPRTTLFD